VRVWSEGRSKSLISWAVVFQGLYPVFPTNGEEWSPSGFCQDTLLFATPFGAFTAMECVIPPPINPQKFVQFTLPTSEGPPRPSYTLKNLVALHRLQRSVLEEVRSNFNSKIKCRGFCVLGLINKFCVFG